MIGIRVRIHVLNKFFLSVRTSLVRDRRRHALDKDMRIYHALLLILLLPKTLLAQVGPAGVGTAASNILWLDASRGVTLTGEAVSKWNDASGNGNHAAQTTATQRPLLSTNSINGYPSILFDNDQVNYDFLTVPDNSTLEGMSGLTGFVVYRLLAGTVTSAPRCFFSKRNGVDIQEAYDWFLWNNGTNLVQNLDIDNTNNRVSSTGNYVPGNTYLNGFTYHGAAPSDANDQTLYDGNATVGSHIESTTSIPNYTSDLHIGILKGHTGTGANVSRFNGHISEIILYNKVLNDAQRIIVNNYLSAKYNTPLSSLDLYRQDNVAQGNYDHDVAGIGRTTAANTQLDSRGSGIVLINNPSGLDNNEFLLWGHDNATLGAWGVWDFPATTQGRLARVWRVSEVSNTGTAIDVGNVDMTFDLNGMGAVIASDLRLLVDTDNDGIFADETPIAGATNMGGGNYRFAAVSALVNGRRFTLGTINYGQTPLPIELLSFTATDSEKDVRLDWATASEVDNAFFMVERSMDMVSWEGIIEVAGAGNSQQRMDYVAFDSSPLLGTFYYRLRQTDTDGSSKLSTVVAITRSVTLEARIFPMPFQERIVIEILNEQLLSVDLYNVAGQRITVPMDWGAERVTLDTYALPIGSYVIHVKTENGASTTAIVKGQ